MLPSAPPQSRHSCVADRLPVVVRFPAGPRVSLKTVDPPKGNGLGQKKIHLLLLKVCCLCIHGGFYAFTSHICCIQTISQVSCILYKKRIGTHREKKHVLTLTLMLERRKSACKTSAGSSKIFRWLAPLLGPNLDPKTGPKHRPKRRNENVTQLDPILGSIFGSKNRVSHRRISLLPANVLQADLRPSSLNMNVNTYLFSLCVPRPLATVEVSLSQPCFEHFFVGPVLGAMMKQVCWHSRRSEAHRGLPEARSRTQNVMARGQSEAHGDSNLYNTRQD